MRLVIKVLNKGKEEIAVSQILLGYPLMAVIRFHTHCIGALTFSGSVRVNTFSDKIPSLCREIKKIKYFNNGRFQISNIFSLNTLYSRYNIHY